VRGEQRGEGLGEGEEDRQEEGRREEEEERQMSKMFTKMVSLREPLASAANPPWAPEVHPAAPGPVGGGALPEGPCGAAYPGCQGQLRRRSRKGGARPRLWGAASGS